MREEKGLRKPLRKWRKGERLQEGGGAGRHRVLLLFSPLEMILHHRATTQRVGVSLPVGNSSDTT